MSILDKMSEIVTQYSKHYIENGSFKKITLQSQYGECLTSRLEDNDSCKIRRVH